MRCRFVLSSSPGATKALQVAASYWKAVACLGLAVMAFFVELCGKFGAGLPGSPSASLPHAADKEMTKAAKQ